MKKIGINAILYAPSHGGIAVYMKYLIQECLKHESKPYFFVKQNEIKNLDIQKKSSQIIPVHIPTSPAALRLSLECVIWPYLLKRYNIQCFHSTISYLPPGINKPSIVTVHDLRVFHYPETFSTWRRKYLMKTIPESIRRANKIIAISHCTRKDIIDLFACPPEKIKVIPHGIDQTRLHMTFSEILKNATLKKYCSYPYLLLVGHLEPRKNFLRFLQAFQYLKTTKNISEHVVIVGKSNRYTSIIKQEIDRLSLKPYVHLTDFVNYTELVILYQNARLVVSPSIFEGFGFTPLEGMAAGKPVIASNCCAHLETLSQAALYFDPFDVKDMAEKIYVPLREPQLYNSLVLKGAEQAAKYSWETCCKKTIKLYEDISNTL
ncbi:MAG: glycosyltransferase family 1 protein [candidate division KSB1 bacterium]|nr:glycosyltransferase family 1 protein [candidate division KSB1 bacterium]